MAWWLWAVLSLSAHAEVIDRVVATVQEQLVTSSEVAFDAVLTPLDASPSPFWALASDPEERLIRAAIVRELAGGVALYQPPAAEITARVEALRAKFTDSASWDVFLTTWGLDEDALRTVLLRRMVVERYLVRNIRGTSDEFATGCEQLLTAAAPRLRIRRIPLAPP